MDVTLPQLAEGADSGTVVSILVSEGDTVENEQTILELENEKAIAPIPSTAAGTVSKIHVSEGDTVSVGQKLISIDDGSGGGAESGAPKEEKPKQEQPQEKPAETAQPAQAGQTGEQPRQQTTEYAGQTLEDPIFGYRYESRSGFPPPASPTVRDAAEKVGIDLYNVRGTGNGGRILLEDLKNYVKRLHELAFANRQQAQQGAPAGQPAKQAAPLEEFGKWGDIKREKMSGIRKTISQRMQGSWNTIPHVNQFDEADITDLMELRKKYKSAYSKKDANLTLTALAIKAVLAGLKEYPIFNASVDESSDEIVYKNYYHIGIAVDTDAGLVVPVIRDVEQKSLLDISLELQEMADKSRDRKLGNDDMKGSSFTISNLGGIGGSHFTPIVNQPNTAILGIGKGSQRPAIVEGKTQARLFMPLCVSYDHRVIDGATGARFITKVVEAFEQFPEDEIKLSKK